MKRALITGIDGQDGSYLAELLLEKGYEVAGIVKRHSVTENQFTRIDHIRSKLNVLYGDVTDPGSLNHVVRELQPDEVYNLAAQSHVRISFDQPILTIHSTALGVVNLLEAVRVHKPDARFYQASSSEMFGNSIDPDGFQRETTPMVPTSPYACSKTFAFHISRTYRDAYGLFICNGILFNHESPRRGTNFVTNKICKEAVRIKFGLADKLMLGNIDARRDWGHAKDYVRAMWMMLQNPTPDDYVCATGEVRSVREFVQAVFGRLGLDWEKHVEIDQRLFRPAELHVVRGDSSKIRERLGWRPEITFDAIVDEMVEFWTERISRQANAEAHSPPSIVR